MSAYDAVVVGGPMVLGWHRGALAFLAKRRKSLIGKPLALFMTALHVTGEQITEWEGVPIHLDPKVLKTPVDPDRLSFKEKRTGVAQYLKPVLRKTRMNLPVSIAFLAGKLDYGKLSFFRMLFVMLIIGAKPGDFRHWDSVQKWADSLRPLLGLDKEES